MFKCIRLNYLILFISFIFTDETNYISIQNSVSSYSKLIPTIGKIVVGDEKPYSYLIKSINNFVNQEDLIKIMEENKFLNCSYKNLSGGIVAIHSGWKI